MAKVTVIMEDTEEEDMVKLQMQFDPPIKPNVQPQDLTVAQIIALKVMREYSIKPTGTMVH